MKSPKVYFRDVGLLHHLLGIQRADELGERVRAVAFDRLHLDVTRLR